MTNETCPCFFTASLYSNIVVIKVWSKFLEGYVKIKHWFLFPKAKLCFKQWLLPLFVKLLFPCCDRQLSTEVMDGENCAQNYQRTNRQHTDSCWRSSLRSTETETESGKLLPILFLPANHKRKERESYYGERDQVRTKIKVVAAYWQQYKKKTEVQLTRMHERRET